MVKNRKAVLFNSTTSSNHLGCYLTSIGLRRLLAESGIEIVFECNVNQYDLSFAKMILDANPTYLVVVNGEGTFHDDQPYAVFLINFLDVLTNKKLLLNSQFKSMGRAHIDKVKRFDLVQARTKIDFEYGLKSGLNNTAYCPDMLFYSGISNSLNSMSDSAKVVITDSHLSSETTRLFDAYKKMEKRAKWVNFHFLPSGGPKLPARYKRVVAGAIRKIYSGNYCYRAQNVLSRVDLSTLLADFMSARGVITGRYHGACLAIALNKPLVYGNTNTSKIVDLCDDFGVGLRFDKFDVFTTEGWNKMNTKFDSRLLVDPYQSLIFSIRDL